LKRIYNDANSCPSKQIYEKMQNITQNNRICYIFELNYCKKVLQNLSEFCNTPHFFIQKAFFYLTKD